LTINNKFKDNFEELFRIGGCFLTERWYG